MGSKGSVVQFKVRWFVDITKERTRLQWNIQRCEVAKLEAEADLARAEADLAKFEHQHSDELAVVDEQARQARRQMQ
jgi:hypothetical protein